MRRTKRTGSLLPVSSRLPLRFGLGFGFGIVHWHRSAGNGDDVVLDRGDRAAHTRPDADTEALFDGLADLLLLRYLVALRDERVGRLQVTTA